MYVPSSIPPFRKRSEEHTSELQSRSDLECRLLLEKNNSLFQVVLDPNPLATLCPAPHAARRDALFLVVLDLMCAAPLSQGHLVFFFNDTATTEIYPLSLHDALPI